MKSISNLLKLQLPASLSLNVDETGFFFTLQNRLTPRLEVSPAKEQVLESCKENESERSIMQKEKSSFSVSQLTICYSLQYRFHCNIDGIQIDAKFM